MALHPHWPPSNGTSILLYPPQCHPRIPMICTESCLVAVFPSDLILWTLFPVVLFCWNLLISYYSKWNKGFFFIFPTCYMSCPSHPPWYNCPNNCRYEVHCNIYIYIYIYIFGASVLALFRSVIKCPTNTHSARSPFLTLVSHHA